jgi:hypothetical protein
MLFGENEAAAAGVAELLCHVPIGSFLLGQFAGQAIANTIRL